MSKRAFILLLIILLVTTCGIGNTAFARKNPSVIITDEAQKFLNESMCSEENMRIQFMDFIGQSIPFLNLASSKLEWLKTAEKIRNDLISQVFLKNVPSSWLQEPLNTEWVDSIHREDYIIYKLRYECLSFLYNPTLLNVPKNLFGERLAFIEISE